MFSAFIQYIVAKYYNSFKRMLIFFSVIDANAPVFKYIDLKNIILTRAVVVISTKISSFDLYK